MPANRIGCDEFRGTLRRPDRRAFVKAGAFGAGALALDGLLRAEDKLPTSQTKINNVILLWMRGGPSQHETWDPKPDAPAEVRGEFGATRTNVPGIQICDLLPMSAKIMDKWSIVRSLHHHDAGHSAGDQICFTGYNSGPNPDDEHPPVHRVGRLEATRPPLDQGAALRDDPAAHAGRRRGVPGRGAQAVRDAAPTRPSRGRSSCRTSSSPRA